MPYPLLLLPLALGCGDPLLSAPAINGLVNAPAPAEPAWNLRWLEDEELVIDCAVEKLDAFNQADLILGELDLAPPQVYAPPTWVDESERGYAYALGLLSVVDEELWEFHGEEDEEDEGGATPDLALALSEGTWGVSGTWALLFVDGDLEAAGAELLVGDGDEGHALSGSPSWVRWLPEVVYATNNAEGALILPSAQELEVIESSGILTTSLLYADEATRMVITAEGLAGARFVEGCNG
ncbi:MAG: hypothetical protein H6740_15495 [Alphaproteobacteria bacterium]|nr:hypothetical protein [Alphaproteobacteria bacterium]